MKGLCNNNKTIRKTLFINDMRGKINNGCASDTSLVDVSILRTHGVRRWNLRNTNSFYFIIIFVTHFNFTRKSYYSELSTSPQATDWQPGLGTRHNHEFYSRKHAVLLSNQLFFFFRHFQQESKLMHNRKKTVLVNLSTFVIQFKHRAFFCSCYKWPGCHNGSTPGRRKDCNFSKALWVGGDGSLLEFEIWHSSMSSTPVGLCGG